MSSPRNQKTDGDFKAYLINELKKDPEFAAEYLNAAIRDGDPAVFLMALGDLLKAKGVSSVSKKTGLNRENLYRIFSQDGNPQIKSVFALLDALGLKLKTEPTTKTRRRSKKAVPEKALVF
jgi:probable addiction module antidote protein